MKRNILIDAGYWIGLADERDQHHQEAVDLFQHLQRSKVLLAWPVTYEILRTKHAKHTKYVRYLETIKKALATLDVIFVDDAPYRKESLAVCLDQRPGGRGFSLVDMVLRAIIDGHHQEIGHVVTFNPRDFYDICGPRQIGILPDGIIARR